MSVKNQSRPAHVGVFKRKVGILVSAQDGQHGLSGGFGPPGQPRRSGSTGAETRTGFSLQAVFQAAARKILRRSVRCESRWTGSAVGTGIAGGARQAINAGRPGGCRSTPLWRPILAHRGPLLLRWARRPSFSNRKKTAPPSHICSVMKIRPDFAHSCKTAWDVACRHPSGMCLRQGLWLCPITLKHGSARSVQRISRFTPVSHRGGAMPRWNAAWRNRIADLSYWAGTGSSGVACPNWRCTVSVSSVREKGLGRKTELGMRD